MLTMIVSCAAKLRGDDPPESLENTVWIGTNKAREEVIIMEFGTEEKVGFFFTCPSSNGQDRDTTEYSGTYVYDRHDAADGTATVKGVVRLSLHQVETGEQVSAVMNYYSSRFFLDFKGSSYPSDRVE